MEVVKIDSKWERESEVDLFTVNMFLETYFATKGVFLRLEMYRFH